MYYYYFRFIENLRKRLCKKNLFRNDSIHLLHLLSHTYELIHAWKALIKISQQMHFKLEIQNLNNNLKILKGNALHYTLIPFLDISGSLRVDAR